MNFLSAPHRLHTHQSPMTYLSLKGSTVTLKQSTSPTCQLSMGGPDGSLAYLKWKNEQATNNHHSATCLLKFKSPFTKYKFL